MSYAGNINRVWALAGAVAMTNATGANVKADNVTTNIPRDLLETTQFGDEFKRRIQGLKDANITVSGDYDPGDTGQGVLYAGGACYIGIYPQGTAVAGIQFPGIVESFSISADVGGKVTYTATVQGNVGEIVALPLRP